MANHLSVGTGRLGLEEATDVAFLRRGAGEIELSEACLDRVRRSHERLLELIERRIPVYGVTTGFGDSCQRIVRADCSERLQDNLVSYLLCGTGAELPPEACRATLLIRLNSLARGYSGVSPELIERMSLYLRNDWIPAIPREGSLGASGDLIPLAYLARALQGEGALHVGGTRREASEVLRQAGISPYRLKPKEGLALVNGTSAMAGLCLVNLNSARYLTELACLSSAWLCLALGGRTEPFGQLVNDRAKPHPGQVRAAGAIRALLEQESYRGQALEQLNVREIPVQDRYSLRCAPQILGPVLETLEQFSSWLGNEINGVSDNPLVDPDGELAMGGNFYGGYLGHGMDYLKICLAHVADLLDRQLTILIDDKSNRGLPPNLANWPGIPEEERFLHHGLKGLHQAVNAITSEVLAKATPNGIFSRSSESHNQDKVSLGMSAAVQCHEQLEQLFTIQAMYLGCLAQALDLRGTRLRGGRSQAMYEAVRGSMPFIERDQPLGGFVHQLTQRLKKTAANKGKIEVL